MLFSPGFAELQHAAAADLHHQTAQKRVQPIAQGRDNLNAGLRTGLASNFRFLAGTTTARTSKNKFAHAPEDSQHPSRKSQKRFVAVPLNPKP